MMKDRVVAVMSGNDDINAYEWSNKSGGVG